jgi:hypothetical protein
MQEAKDVVNLNSSPLGGLIITLKRNQSLYVFDLNPTGPIFQACTRLKTNPIPRIRYRYSLSEERVPADGACIESQLMPC